MLEGGFVQVVSRVKTPVGTDETSVPQASAFCGSSRVSAAVRSFEEILGDKELEDVDTAARPQSVAYAGRGRSRRGFKGSNGEGREQGHGTSLHRLSVCHITRPKPFAQFGSAERRRKGEPYPIGRAPSSDQ